MKGEYAALRAEILAWQNRRFVVLTISVSLVTGILGLDAVTQERSLLDWGFISAILLFFLGSCATLTWYARRSNAVIAAYIMVFHEAEAEGWEKRHNEIKKKIKLLGLFDLNLNLVILLIYIVLSIVSILIPWAVRGYKSASAVAVILLSISAIWLLFNLYLLLRYSSRDYFVNEWETLDS